MRPLRGATGHGLRATVVLACLATVAHAQPAPDPAPPGTPGSGQPTIIQLPDDFAAPEVSAAAAPTVVALGAPFTVFITATYAAGVEVNLREPIDLGPAFEVRRKLSENRRTVDGRTTREWQLQVVGWEVGELQIAPIAITYTAYGKADQIAANAVNLKVVGILGDQGDVDVPLRDYHPPTTLTSRDWFWLYVTVGVAIVLGAALGIWWYRARRRRRTVRLVAGASLSFKRIDMTSTRALEQLMTIEQSGVLDRDDDRKRGYAEMVEVIREYLGARYRITTTDLTTSELLRKLGPVAAEVELALIEAWLEGGDLVKYGGLRATTGDARTQLTDARALVVATTEPAPPSEGSKEKVAA